MQVLKTKTLQWMKQSITDYIFNDPPQPQEEQDTEEEFDELFDLWI